MCWKVKLLLRLHENFLAKYIISIWYINEYLCVKGVSVFGDSLETNQLKLWVLQNL